MGRFKPNLLNPLFNRPEVSTGKSSGNPEFAKRRDEILADDDFRAWLKLHKPNRSLEDLVKNENNLETLAQQRELFHALPAVCQRLAQELRLIQKADTGIDSGLIEATHLAQEILTELLLKQPDGFRRLQGALDLSIKLQQAIFVKEQYVASIRDKVSADSETSNDGKKRDKEALAIKRILINDVNNVGEAVKIEKKKLLEHRRGFLLQLTNAEKYRQATRQAALEEAAAKIKKAQTGYDVAQLGDARDLTDVLRQAPSTEQIYDYRDQHERAPRTESDTAKAEKEQREFEKNFKAITVKGLLQLLEQPYTKAQDVTDYIQKVFSQKRVGNLQGTEKQLFIIKLFSQVLNKDFAELPADQQRLVQQKRPLIQQGLEGYTRQLPKVVVVPERVDHLTRAETLKRAIKKLVGPKPGSIKALRKELLDKGVAIEDWAVNQLPDKAEHVQRFAKVVELVMADQNLQVILRDKTLAPNGFLESQPVLFSGAREVVVSTHPKWSAQEIVAGLRKVGLPILPQEQESTTVEQSMAATAEVSDVTLGGVGQSELASSQNEVVTETLNRGTSPLRASSATSPVATGERQQTQNLDLQEQVRQYAQSHQMEKKELSKLEAVVEQVLTQQQVIKEQNNTKALLPSFDFIINTFNHPAYNDNGVEVRPAISPARVYQKYAEVLTVLQNNEKATEVIRGKSVLLGNLPNSQHESGFTLKVPNGFMYDSSKQTAEDIVAAFIAEMDTPTGDVYGGEPDPDFAEKIKDLQTPLDQRPTISPERFDREKKQELLNSVSNKVTKLRQNVSGLVVDTRIFNLGRGSLTRQHLEHSMALLDGLEGFTKDLTDKKIRFKIGPVSETTNSTGEHDVLVLDVSQPPAEVLSSIARKLTPKEAAPKAPQPVEYAPGFVEVYSGELKNILEQPTGISCSLLFGTFSKVATDSGNWLAGNLPGRSLPSGQLYLVPKMENATPANYDAEFQAAYDKVPQSKASGAVRIVKPAVVDVTTSKIIQKGLVNFQ